MATPSAYPQQSVRDHMELPPRRKRQPRKLDYLKCDFCRKAKIKCNPANRTWPKKCEPCERRNLQCSAPMRKAQPIETPTQNKQDDPGPMGVVEPSGINSGDPSQMSAEEALDLLSLRYILNMAVEELYLIGETYLAPIEHDNLYSHYMDRLHGMTELYSELSDILDQTLNEKLNQLSFPVVKEIARAMLCLSRPISLLSETSMFFTFRDTARRWRIRRHYGIACLLIKRYLLVHPHMVPSFSGEFLDDWKAFLKRWQGAFHKFKIDKSLAYLKLQVNGCDIMETQLLLPRALLRVPAILEEVRKDGRKDCISRPLLFMEHDAGIPWTCVAVTKGQTDILGRSRAHIMFFDGQTPTEIVSGRLVQKLTEQDIFENNHFLGKFDDGGCLGRGLSPLSLAAMKGYRGIFEKIHHAMPDLLSKSFLKDAIRDVMRTHLHWAASCGQTETVRFLCSNYHVRLLHDSEDAEGKTAIHLASEFNHVRVMQCLLECITSTATEELSMEIIDSTDNYGRTAFWYAAKKGHVDILRLLEPYADTGRRATNGHTPLSIACFKGHTEVARYLLGLPIELRPDVNGTNGHRTPFYNAKIGGHTDCIQILREHGAIDARLAPSDVDDDSMSEGEDST